ncbi:MAG: hypothetical protein U5N26_05045 [Candidatus Marinimicrobia bacterium]|nr:hypothetical protein [Candidatus Neomarinimicrobiota bacterium]
MNTSSELTSANNILVSDQNCVYYQDSAYVNLADWQGTGQDLKSDSLDVTFAAANDFHLAAPSDADVNLVYPKVPGVDTDIDGDARPNPSFAFAGADEGSDAIEYPDYDIDEDFADDSDVVNWRSENSGWTSRTHADTVLELTDAGWTFDARRTVKAMPNSFYKATARIKTGSFDTSPSQFLYFGVDGLSAEPYQVSCISEDEFTTFTVIGYAENEEGSLDIFGQGAGGRDTAWVDEYTFENNFVPGANKISTVAEARQVPDGELVATQGIVTANTIGAPVFMQDENAGISLYDWDFFNDDDICIVEEGDEILVIGEADSFGGMKQISYTNEKYHVLSKGNEIEPTLITVPDLESRDYQGMLVMIEDVDTVAGDSPGPMQAAMPPFPSWMRTVTNSILRIDKEGEMDGAAPPVKWPLILVGVVGEFFDGPQVLPRYMEDFITNYAPGPFTLLNPVHEDTITSLDDSAFADINIGTETIKTLFFNWTESIDPDEGDEVTYEVFINPEGPEEALTTSDTVFNLPIPQDRPWDMNGTHDIHVTATDLMDAVTSTDTISVTFDFKAPPELAFADVVLVDGVPKFYAEFTMPIVQELGDYKFVDYSDGEAVSDPTAIDSIAPNAIMLSGDLAEDHKVALRYSGVAAEGDDAGEPLTVDAESKTIDVLIPFSDAHPEDAEKVIEGFEDGTGTFWAPTGSGFNLRYPDNFNA